MKCGSYSGPLGAIYLLTIYYILSSIATPPRHYEESIPYLSFLSQAIRFKEIICTQLIPMNLADTNSAAASGSWESCNGARVPTPNRLNHAPFAFKDHRFPSTVLGECLRPGVLSSSRHRDTKPLVTSVHIRAPLSVKPVTDARDVELARDQYQTMSFSPKRERLGWGP